jgi:hypothetical protein
LSLKQCLQVTGRKRKYTERYLRAPDGQRPRATVTYERRDKQTGTELAEFFSSLPRIFMKIPVAKLLAIVAALPTKR